MEDLARLPGEKALITPGIIELGSATRAIHFHLGEQAAGVFDRIFLVGSSERTKSFYQGVKSVKTSLPIQFLQSDAHLWPLIDQLAIDHQWILLENDLPDTY
jgi:UDP-N-acetylmuramoyl-tripeptide--D-alanyl-D-alanine ligase